MNHLIPREPRRMIKEAGAWGTLVNQGKRLGQYGKSIVYHNGKFNPIQAVPRAMKRGYESTAAATSPTKTKNMVSDALNNAMSGKDIRDVATGMQSGGPIRQYLRDKGWLSVGRKTKGTYSQQQVDDISNMLRERGILQKSRKGVERVNEKLDQETLQKALRDIRSKHNATGSVGRWEKTKDVMYNALPGEKAMLVGFGGMGAAGELTSTHTEQGRKKSIGERIGRAGVGAASETLSAPLGIARRFGALGAAGELAGTTLPYTAMSAADKKIGNPAMKKQASIPKNPRSVLRQAIRNERSIIRSK